uniref:hypothetical protein n=1 Tax=Cephaleuros karstenii TaxID=1985640 RepID=UPI001EE14D74|nr:hypothetical protein MFR52_pgp058 [Cephaleuros karstenii]UIB39101.1 hypothetical protein [Cephaleuros karstenii]
MVFSPKRQMTMWNKGSNSQKIFNFLGAQMPTIEFSKKKGKNLIKPTETTSSIIPENDQNINETLFILFYAFPSTSLSSKRSGQNNLEERKPIKLAGFSFLYYLFDNPYFIYNNYKPKEKNI